MIHLTKARALALVLFLFAATPAPKVPPHPPMPKTAVHAVLLVEVNAKGQVVQVKSGHATGSKYPFFNAELYGNAQQMWIRKPDGSAIAGLYRIIYDWNPKTQKIERRAPVLVTAGGSWANEPGAVTRMVEEATKAKQAEEKRERKSLPPLHAIVGPSAKPTAKP